MNNKIIFKGTTLTICKGSLSLCHRYYILVLFLRYTGDKVSEKKRDE